VLQNDLLLENAPVQKFVPEIASLKPAASVQIQKLSYQEDYSINRYSMHSYLRNDFSDTRDNFSNKNASKIDKDALIGVVVALLSPHVPFAHVLYGSGIGRCCCGELFRVRRCCLLKQNVNGGNDRKTVGG
jgi:hypothetical protein